jgi:hypothetical protein
MRALSLLIVVAIVGYLAYRQLGPGSSATSPTQPAYQVAKEKAVAVDAQVQDQFAKQAESLSRMETGATTDAQ